LAPLAAPHRRRRSDPPASLCLCLMVRWSCSALSCCRCRCSLSASAFFLRSGLPRSRKAPAPPPSKLLKRATKWSARHQLKAQGPSVTRSFVYNGIVATGRHRALERFLCPRFSRIRVGRIGGNAVGRPPLPLPPPVPPLARLPGRSTGWPHTEGTTQTTSSSSSSQITKAAEMADGIFLHGCAEASHQLHAIVAHPPQKRSP